MRPVNLLPAKHRPRGGGGSGAGADKRSYVALGSLAGLVLAVLVYVLAANQVSSRNAEIAKTRQQVQQAESQAVTLSSFGDFASIKQTRLAAVKTLATARIDWERLFRELARVLPERVWLTDFDAKVAAATGGAGPAEGPAGPVVGLKGCAAKHSRVADVLVRLRELHGAEEVELRKSGKNAGGAEAGAASTAGSSGGEAGGGSGCGPYYAFEINVQLREIVPGGDDGAVAPERVPASLGGGG